MTDEQRPDWARRFRTAPPATPLALTDGAAAALAAIGTRLRMARVARGLTQAALARPVGVSRAAISQWEGGDVEMSLSKLTRVADVLGCDLAALIAGPAQEVADGKRPESGHARHGGDAGDGDGAGDGSGPSGPDADGIIAEVKEGLGAASGEHHHGGLQADWWRLPPAVLAGLGCAAATSRIFRVTTPAMAPAIPRGARVLVDFAQTAIHDGEIYALDSGGALLIRRLHLKAGDPARVEMVCDAERDRRSEWPVADLRIAGRVVALLAVPL